MYYIVAVADAAGEVDEINEANNTRAVAVKVMPDLVVVALAAPASARAGATISVTDTTKNQGEGTAAATTTRFYLSTNASYDVGDVSLNSRAVPSLATLQASAATTVLTIPDGTPPGAYYLVALADADGVVGELHESNNTRVRTITIVP
jgi:subtilase family serine protease